MTLVAPMLQSFSMGKWRSLEDPGVDIGRLFPRTECTSGSLITTENNEHVLSGRMRIPDEFWMIITGFNADSDGTIERQHA